MIQGIVVQMESAELAKHLAERALHHSQKESFYRGQVESLKKGMADVSNVTNNPISSLENSAASHANKRAFFQFLSTHVVPNEVYRLSDEDLARMEVYSKYL